MEKLTLAYLIRKTSDCLQAVLLIALVMLFIFTPCAVKRSIQTFFDQQTETTHQYTKATSRQTKDLARQTENTAKTYSHASESISNTTSVCSISSYKAENVQSQTVKYQVYNLFIITLPDFLVSGTEWKTAKLLQLVTPDELYNVYRPLYLQNRSILI